MIVARTLIVAPFESDPAWNPIDFSWSLMGILLAGTVVLTIAFVIWTVLQPEEPDHSTDDLVKRAVERDRARARTIARRQDADTGRADASQPELR